MNCAFVDLTFRWQVMADSAADSAAGSAAGSAADSAAGYEEIVTIGSSKLLSS